jgi:uncharacterized protein YkwD
MTAPSGFAAQPRRIGRLLAPAALAAALLALPARGAYEPVPGKVADGKLAPGRPPAARFGEDPAATCPDLPLFRRLKERLEETARSSKRPAPQADGRLCRAAEIFLALDGKAEPRDAVLAFASQASGLPLTVRRVIQVVLPTDDSSLLAENLSESIAGNFGPSASQPRYGIAAVRKAVFVSKRAEASTRLVLLLQDIPFALDPIPRRLAAGEKARLSGKLLGDYANPRIAISDVLGRLSRPEVPPGRSFEAEVSCGDRAGRIAVEIAGELGGSPALLARFPIACATELATSVPLANPDPWPADPRAQERKMFDLVNAERTAGGLKALAWDDALAGVARGIAESIREGARRGTYDVPGDVVERLKKVGIASPVVLQNPAQARGAEEANGELLVSPSHRVNIMSPEVTNGGMGIAPEAGPDGASSVFVAQLFIRELPPLDPEAVRQQLRAAVAQKRKDARQSPVTLDPQLEELAQRYAVELAAAGGALPKARKDALTAPLSKAFKVVQVLAGAKADPLDFAEEPEVVSAGKFAGVGAALGMHPTLGRNAIYAVVLVGTKR